MLRSSRICDQCDQKAVEWIISRRPSDPSELVSTLAFCEKHKLGEPINDKNKLIQALASTYGGCECSAEMVKWMTETDEAILALGKIGILFVSI